MLYGVEYLFSQFRSAVLSSYPLIFLPTPNLLAGEKGEKEKGLMLFNRCSTGASICVLPKMFQPQIQNTAPFGLA